MAGKITYIDEVEIKNKAVLMRADFDVSLNPNQTIANDLRIQKNLPTIKHLLKHNNKLICVAKLGRPKGRDPKFSLKVIIKRLEEYLPNYQIILVDDFLTTDQNIFKNQKVNQILILENIRFYPEEKKDDPDFAKKLASLAEVYVDDAFAMCHRSEASVVGVTRYLPSYGGLLLKKEVEMILQVTGKPRKPVVAIIGGAKVSTKIGLISKLSKITDYLLIGGGLANTFLCAKGFKIGNSFCEYEAVSLAKKLLHDTTNNNTSFELPTDATVADKDHQQIETVKINNIPNGKSIFDIGPETKARFGAIIARAQTIIWNGPVGLFENPSFRNGTDFIYYSITQNDHATSVVGGGDTLAAISKKEYLDKITHLSTGGGAMLELIEKGTLPGLEALDFHRKNK